MKRIAHWNVGNSSLGASGTYCEREGADASTRLTMTPDEALTLAAHLVCLAEPFASHSFPDVLAAVQNT
jgi:hypothetical protein